MSAKCGIPALAVMIAAALGGCVSAPLVPPAALTPVPVAAAPVAAAPVAAAAPCTLPGFLGLTPVCAAVGQEVKHKAAFFGQYFPCLEPMPPLLPLTDPANLASSVPAIAAAAEIKAEQDMAPQKIKALKYLATIGCGGCYAGVEEAFLAALDDCTEEVRFEAVKAIYATAGNPCVHCNNKACCSPKIRKRLEELAFEGLPCPKEPSARVRRMARVALNACGAPPPTEAPPEVPTEVVPDAPLELAPTPAPAPPPEPVAATQDATIRQKASAAKTPSPASTADASIGMETAASKTSIVPPFKSVLDRLAMPFSGAETVVAAATEENAEEALPTGRRDESNDGQTVTDDELLLYYASRVDQYRRPEEVRWESLSAPVDRFSSQEEAMTAFNYLRDRASGATGTAPESFRPDLVTARRHDWTTREQIASKPVADALFTGPVGSVSEVMTDGKQLILVRIVERREACTAPFAEVADQVRTDLLAERAAGSFLPTAPGQGTIVPTDSESVPATDSRIPEGSAVFERFDDETIETDDGESAAILQMSYTDEVAEGLKALSSRRTDSVSFAHAETFAEESGADSESDTANRVESAAFETYEDLARDRRPATTRPEPNQPSNGAAMPRPADRRAMSSAPVAARFVIDVGPAGKRQRLTKRSTATDALGPVSPAGTVERDRRPATSVDRPAPEYGLWQSLPETE